MSSNDGTIKLAPDAPKRSDAAAILDSVAFQEFVVPSDGTEDVKKSVYASLRTNFSKNLKNVDDFVDFGDFADGAEEAALEGQDDACTIGDLLVSMASSTSTDHIAAHHRKSLRNFLLSGGDKAEARKKTAQMWESASDIDPYYTADPDKDIVGAASKLFEMIKAQEEGIVPAQGGEGQSRAPSGENDDDDLPFLDGDNDDDDDLPPLEDHLNLEMIPLLEQHDQNAHNSQNENEIQNQLDSEQNTPRDSVRNTDSNSDLDLDSDSDCDMPSLENIQTQDPAAVEEKVVSWLYTISHQPDPSDQITSTQQSEKNRQSVLSNRIASAEKAAAEHNASQSQSQSQSQPQPLTDPGVCAAINSAKPKFNESTSSVEFDFRHNIIPPGIGVLGGAAQFERQNDGSTALVLLPGAYLELTHNFNPKLVKRGFYCLTITFQIDTLPENTIALTTVDITKSGIGEVVMTREGGVGLAGGDMSIQKLKPSLWNTLTIALNPLCKSNSQIPFTAILNDRTISSTKEVSLLGEKAALKDKMYIFGSNKASLMNRTIKVRSVLMQPKSFDVGQFNSIEETAMSKFLTEAAEQKVQMYRSMSLSNLYNKPPAAWNHPLISSTLITSNPREELNSNMVRVADCVLWSNLLSQTADAQSRLFPQIYPKLNQDHDLHHNPDHSDNSNSFPPPKDNTTSIAQALCSISNMFVDAAALIKVHPALTEAPTGAAFVKRIVHRIDSLQFNEATIIPFLIRYRVKPLDPKEPLGATQRPIFLIVQRGGIENGEMCSVTVCNTEMDAGVKFHSLSGAGPEGTMQYKPCITAENVPLANLTSYGAWFGFHETIWSSKQVGFASISEIYFKLFPILIGQSYESVLYGAQKRDIAFAKWKLAGEPIGVGKDNEQNDQNVQNGENVQNRHQNDQNPKPNNRSILLTKFSDCVSAPVFGTGTTTHLYHFATLFLLRRLLGCGEGPANGILLCLKLRCLDLYFNDLTYINVINPSELIAINVAIRDTAGFAASCIEGCDGGIGLNLGTNSSNLQISQHFENSQNSQHLLNSSYSPNQLFAIYRGISRLQKEVRGTRAISYSKKTQDTLLLDDGGLGKSSQHTLFGSVEQFIIPRDDESVLDLSSAAALSFDLLDLPQRIRSWGDLSYVLRRTKDVCVILRANAALVKNAQTFTLSVITHIFTTIIPVPTSAFAPIEQRHSDPFAQPATYSELNQVLELCAQFLSILYACTTGRGDGAPRPLNPSPPGHQSKPTVQGDADDEMIKDLPYESQIIAGSIFALIDLILHKPPSDQRSHLVDTVNQGGFGLSLGHWTAGTASFHFLTPEIALLRSKVIEYFSYSRYRLNILNLYNMGGETEYAGLFRMLMAGMADEKTIAQMAGSLFDFELNPIFFKIYELTWIVKGVIAFRALCAARNVLTGITSSQSGLFIPQFQLNINGHKIVGAINRTRLPPFVPKSVPKYVSYADASAIINKHLKKIHMQTSSEESFIPTVIQTEDDILHIKTLPHFDQVLPPSDIEQLLSYLTVPYLRIPLITSFFAQEDRCHALKNTELRDLFSAVLFEQGNLIPFHRDSYLPTQVPSEDKSLIGTRYGLLLNELVNNPRLIVENLIKMYNSALELDIGTVQSAATTIILFITRLLARVENYINWLIEVNTNVDEVAEVEAEAEAEAKRAKKAIYRAETSLPGLLLAPDQFSELISVQEILTTLTHGAALDKLNIWSAQLFTTVHMKLTQNEFAHQKADKYVKMAQKAIADQRELDHADQCNDDEIDDEEEKETKAQAQKRLQKMRSRLKGKPPTFASHHSHLHAIVQERNERNIKMPRFKRESDGVKKFQLHSNAQFKNQMRNAGLLGTSKRSSVLDVAPLSDDTKRGYKFEDLRPRRVISYQRRYTKIQSLDQDTAVGDEDGEGARKDNEALGENGKGKGDEEFVVNRVESDGSQTVCVRLDGSELTDLFELSCIIHAHILMIRRNVLEMTPKDACHIVCSVMYLSTHFKWTENSKIISSHSIFEIINKLRRSLVTTIDALGQQGLNDFMEKVVKVTTSIAPLDLASMISYLKTESGYNASQMHNPLPPDHPLANQVKGFEEFQLGWEHSLSMAKCPIGYEGFLAAGQKNKREQNDQNHDQNDQNDQNSSAESLGIDPSHFIPRTLRHFGYCPGSRGRYTSLADPFSIKAEDYFEYFSQLPGDLYNKNLDCEVNLQTLSISIRNATMKSIPTIIESSNEWRTVFKKSLQAALIESNSHFDHYRVIGTGYDTYFRKSQTLSVELINQRLYDASELSNHEQWLVPIVEPYRLSHLSDPWFPVILYLPDSTPTDTNMVILQVVAKRTGAVLALMKVYKTRKFIELYHYVESNLRLYPSLVHSSDIRYSLAPLALSTSDRERMWNVQERWESEWPNWPNRPGLVHVTIKRDISEPDNLSGTTETFIPRRLLLGSIPELLLRSHTFWQDTRGDLRGYPIDSGTERGEVLTANFADSIIFCELISVSKGDSSALKSTCFQISKVPIPVMKTILAAQLKAAAFGNQVLPQGALLAQNSSMKALNAKNENFDENQKAQNAQDAQNNDAIFELINLRDCPRGSAPYQVASVLSRTVNTLSVILPWKPSPLVNNEVYSRNRSGLALNGALIVSHYEDFTPDSNPGTITLAPEDDSTGYLVGDDECEELDPISGAKNAVLSRDVDVFKRRAQASSNLINFHLVELPTIGLSFRSQFNSNNEIQLYSVDYNDLYISNIRSGQLGALMTGLPHTLILQNINNELEIFSPATPLERPRIADSPYSTELITQSVPLHESLSYFKFKVHTSHSFAFMPNLTAALYFILAKFLARDYDSVTKLLDSISSDTPFSSAESAIYPYFNAGAADLFDPNAIATSIKLSLATLRAAKSQPWNLTQFAMWYSALNSRSYASTLLRLSYREEYDLLRQLLTTATINTALKMTSENSMHNGVFLLAMSNRFSYLTSLLYRLPSYKVLLPPQSQTNHSPSYATTSMPTAAEFVAWYVQTLPKASLKQIPGHVLNNPTAKPLPGSQGLPTPNNVTFPPPLSTAQEELQATIPLSVMAKLPAKHGFKCDISRLATPFTFIGTLSPLSAQALLSIALRGSLTHSRGHGFLLCYMLLTGDCVFRINNKDDSVKLGTILASLFKDCSHKSPLNFILRLLILKPELTPLFPRLSQFKPLVQIRKDHSNVSSFDLAPFVMMISRVIVKLFVVSPSSLDLRRPSSKSTWKIAPGMARPLEPAAQTISIEIGSIAPSFHSSLLPTLRRELIQPILTDTDCSTRYSVNHNLFLTDEIRAQMGPILKELLAQEISEKTALTSHLANSSSVAASSSSSSPSTNGITQLSQLQSQPLATLDIDQFVQQVTRADKSLPPISESLPFEISSHPAAQNGNAKMIKERLEKDIVVFAKAANLKCDSLLASLSSTTQVRTVLSNPTGDAMKTALSQLERLAKSLIMLRTQDEQFVSVGQKFVNVVVNNVALVPEFQQKIEKMYQISHTCFVTDDLKHVSSASSNPIEVLEDRELTERIHYLIAREAGIESKMWFEYVVGSLLSSRGAYDLLKINPYIPDAYLALVYSLTETVLLRTNRIAHINRVLNEIIDMQDLLSKAKSISSVKITQNSQISSQIETDRNSPVENVQHSQITSNPIDTVVLNSILQKSQTVITSLFTKRYYFHKVETDEVEFVFEKLKHDETIKTAWKSSLQRSRLLTLRPSKLNAMRIQGGVVSGIVVEQLSRLLDTAIMNRDMALLRSQIKSRNNVNAAAATGTMLKKQTALTSSNAKHLAKQLLVDPLSQTQSHPLKASCPITDRVGFLLKAVKKRSGIYINETWERVKMGQGVNSHDNPLWEVLHQTPDHVPSLYKTAKQGRFGLSMPGRIGMTAAGFRPQESNNNNNTDKNNNGLKKYDPRFLVFEWTWSLLLRQTQVEMIDSFVDKIEAGESIVQGILMGMGKTTILMPLLFQLLSTSKENSYSRHLGERARNAACASRRDSHRAGEKSRKEVVEELTASNQDKLIVSVVPPALLEFSRSIMRTTFSSVIYKRVITFHFERATEPTYELLYKLKRAAAERSVVISTPTSIKSVQLKFLELQYSIANPALGRDANAATQMSILAEILQLFKRSVLVIDEVDTVLQPLKSELNFPFSQKTDLDFSPLRWSLALHVMDAVLYYDQRQVPHQFKHSTRAIKILDNLVTTLEYGFSKKYLQSTPHLLLLNEPFYFNKLKTVLIEWVLLFIDTQHLPSTLTHKLISTFFTIPTLSLSTSTDPEILHLTSLLSTISPQHMKLLNLSRDWLNSYLPHILQKVSRVHYGLLSPSDLVLALATDPAIPLSRLKLAIPFKGKDSPSASSEFAHSEIIIGLTISSYAREGLRYTDFVEIMDALRVSLAKELGPSSKRPTNLKYVEWVTAAGGVVMGTGPVKAPPTISTAFRDNQDDFKRQDDTDMDVGADMDMAVEESKHDEEDDDDDEQEDQSENENRVEIVSLRLLKRTNYQQMDRLYNLLKHSPLVIQHYLDTTVFPSCLRHQNLKLSASGVDIGSDLLFSKRIGFSGTPSDLLPLDLGTCQFEVGSDGQVLTTLTSPEVGNVVNVKDNWSITSILDQIATARNPNGTLKYHAFIDIAAVITGMSNLDVAAYLLKNGIGDCVDGVVYLDNGDRKMIILKSTLKSVPVEQCGIPPSRRFAFYDQVHTTGIDIGHRLDCHAAVTLSKDTLFRDFSQGCYRLRQIGQGQTFDILLTPEMRSLIDRTLAPIETDANGKQDIENSVLLAPLKSILKQRNITNPSQINQYQQLARISAFLIINSMISERTQFCQLAIQNTTNLWKKNAFAQLLASSNYFNFKRFPDLESNIKRQKQLIKQQEDTAQQKFLASIETVRDTDRKQYSKLIKKYQSIRRQDLLLDQKRQQQTLLQEYFEQAMVVYGISLKAQVQNMIAKRDPKTALDSLMKALRNHLTSLRKDFYNSNPNSVSKHHSSLLGKIGGYLIDVKATRLVGNGENINREGDGDDVGLMENEKNDQNDQNIAQDPTQTSQEVGKHDVEFVARFATVEQLSEREDCRERDFAFESLMGVFHETVDLTISPTVPKFISFSDSLQLRIKEHEGLLETTEQREACQKIFLSVLETSFPEETFTLSAEMVQTMEDERIKEQEQDKEQQVEIEKYVDCAYDRSHETQVSWPFESLSNPNLDQLPQFYHLNNFSVVPLSTHTLSAFDNKDNNNNNDAEKIAFFSSEENRLKATFPSQFFASSNFFNASWVGARRLKNVCMYLDWSPSLSSLIPMTDMGRIQTRGCVEEDLRDEGIVRDIEMTLKIVTFLSLCEQGRDDQGPLIKNGSINGDGDGGGDGDGDGHGAGKRDYQDLRKLFEQKLEDIELTRDNVDDLLYLLTMRHNVTESHSLPTTAGSGVASEFVLDNKIDVSTLAKTNIVTQLNLDTSHLFNTNSNSTTPTINAKQFVRALAQSTKILYPGNTYQDNRYTVVVSLAEAETLRRIVHLKEEMSMQKLIMKRQKIIKNQQQQQQQQHQHQNTSHSFIDLNLDLNLNLNLDLTLNSGPQPEPEPIIPKTDAGFALRCMNFGGFSLATTTHYCQPSFTQFNDSLLVLRFLNNDIHYSDPQVHALISLMDGNKTTDVFGRSSSTFTSNATTNAAPNATGTLAQFFTSLLSARRRLQTKLMESSLKTILYTPHRYSLLKDSALALVLRKFLDLNPFCSSAFDLFTWMDFNIDTTISPAEFYRAIQYIIVNLWKYYVHGETQGADSVTILSKPEQNPFFITHGDIIQLFTSVLGISAITSNNSSSVGKDGAQNGTGHSQNIKTSSETFQLSRQVFGLNFKDFCTMLKTVEEADADETHTAGSPQDSTASSLLVSKTPNFDSLGLLSPSLNLPSISSGSSPSSHIPSIPLDDGLQGLDHDLFVTMVAQNTLTPDQVNKALYLVPGRESAPNKEKEEIQDENCEATKDPKQQYSNENNPDSSLLSLDAYFDDNADVEENETNAEVLQRLNDVATHPFHHDTKLKNFSLNFTTPTLPPYVKLIGDGHFVDAGTGNVADNYWELKPFSCFVLMLKELNQAHNFPGGQSNFSIEFSAPTIKGADSTKRLFSEFKPIPIATSLGQLYQEFSFAKASLMKHIFCFLTSRDYSYWINPLEIETKVDSEMVQKYLEIDSKSKDSENVDAREQIANWSPELQRAIKYYISCEAAIGEEIAKHEALYHLAGDEVLKNPTLAQFVQSQPENARFLIASHQPSEHSVLPQAPTNSLVMTDRGLHINNCITPSAQSPFSDENFSVLTVFFPDSGTTNDAAMDSMVYGPAGSQGGGLIYLNSAVLVEKMYNFPQLNGTNLSLFGSSDFASAQTPVKLRKFMIHLPNRKEQQAVLHLMKKGKEVTMPKARFQRNFVTAVSTGPGGDCDPGTSGGDKKESPAAAGQVVGGTLGIFGSGGRSGPFGAKKSNKENSPESSSNSQ